MSCINKQSFVWNGLLARILLTTLMAHAQYRQEPGRSIGSVRVQGNLIVLTLDEDVLGTPNLFNLTHRALRFTPESSRYRVETISSHWDPEFGPEMRSSDANLQNFAFPFSGKSWSSFSVGMTGSIIFGSQPVAAGRATAEANRTGGLCVDRFAELQQAGPAIINTIPAISVFFKPRMSGTRYLKESADRAVITWSLTEPVGGVQDMTWTPTVNRFQAVLYKDGTIELNYDEVHAEDAIVGVYPMVTEGNQTEIATVTAAENAAVAAQLNIKSVKLAAVDGLFLKVTIETRGPVLPENDPAIMGIAYRVCLDRAKPAVDCTQNDDTVWTIQGGGGRGRGRGATPRYIAFGPGVQPEVKVSVNNLSMQGTLPGGYKAGDQIFLSAAVQAPGSPPAVVDRVSAHPIKLAGLTNPEVHLSSVRKSDGPFPVVYEAFHYLKPPRANDLTCTIIKALGDKFDMLAYYSDFRIDNPEAGTSSTGPLGGGPAGGAVTGIGANQRNLAGYCSF